MKSPIALAASLVLGFGSIATAIGAGDGEATDWVAAKQARLRSVVAELASRDVSDLSAAKREARTRALALLSDYAERAEFTVHHEAWPRSVPLFIDERGTRCALASVLDGFGEDAVVRQLAVQCNDAYLAEIPDDPEVARCLDELGLTLDEAAYIQAPGGFVDYGPSDTGRPNNGKSKAAGPPPPPMPTTDNDVNPTHGATPPTGNTPKPGSGPATPHGPTTGAPPPSGTPGTARGGGSVARRTHADSAFRWQDWFEAHRDEFVNVRARFHDAFPATPDPNVRGKRPDAAQIRDEILARLADVAHHDDNLRSTAIAMWARGAATVDAPSVLEATLAYLADPHQRDRGWGAVMLAILADPAARAPLSELLTDSEAGRKMLSQTAPISESLRALAAVAYGRSGGSVEVLQATLADSPAAHPDVAAACVVAIGLAAREPSQHVAAISALIGELKRATLPASALAQLPGALLLTGDAAVVPEIHSIVAHFRGPRELRRACALALGESASELDESMRDALESLARRDVDAECRHAAIVALGMLAARHGATASSETVAQLVAFHEDALAGKFRHDEDLAWHALSAGLFVRGRPNDAGTVLPALRTLASKAGDESLRAAACLALGLAKDEIGAPVLIEALTKGSETTATYAAHALGLAGVQSARAQLLELCITTPSERLGFAAASALGCLADPSAIAPLVATFEKTPSAAVRAGLARALGEIGDRDAIPGLLRVAQDPQRDNPARERALAALGIMAQTDDVAWNSAIKHAVDPGAATPSLKLLLNLF